MSSFIVQPAKGPLLGYGRVPGDKSIGHRALLLAALARGESVITGLSDGADNQRTARAIEAMGAGVARRDDDAVVVTGVGLDGLRAPAAPIDCGNSGTTMRLLCGLLAGQAFDSALHGDESLGRRPMRRVIDPLAAMGARITGERGAREGEIYPPLAVAAASGRLRGIRHELRVASAQVKSALILAGLYAEGRTIVKEPGPSRDHTERMLMHMGAPLRALARGVVEVDGTGWDRQLRPVDVAVPADPSAAAFLVCAGLLAGVERLTVGEVCINPTRVGFLDILAEMGALIEREAMRERGGEPIADLSLSRGAGDDLGAVRVEGEVIVRAIDEIPVLAVVASRAHGTSEFRDAAELRVKESDRIATTCAMLRAFGVEVEEHDDGLSVHGAPGKPLTAARIDAAGDHRIAMAATVAALVADGPVRIDDVDNVATSFPDFVPTMQRIGVEIEAAPGQ